MPLMERVRELGADEARIDDETIRVARQALARETARSVKPARVGRRRRAWAGIGIGGLVAGTAVTAIVVGSVLAPVEAPSASAAVFEAAATGADGPAGLQPAAGQFLRLEVAFTWMVPWDADMPDGAHFNNADPDDAEAVLVVEDTNATYVPANHDEEWVRERIPYTVTEAHGDRSEEARAEWDATNPGTGLGGITRYPGGLAEARGDGGNFEYYLDDRDLYADMPEDVPGVIDWFATRYDGEGDSDGLGHYFVETISDVSVFNLAPASARASMLRAFATVDGIDVVASDGDTATLRYERRNSEGETSVIEFTLDTAHGYVLAVTSWPFGVDPGTAPDGAPNWGSRTEANITVVDTAP